MGITRDEWMQALAEVGHDTRENDPGAVTVGEFSLLMNMDRSTAARRLDLLVKMGKATATHKWIVDGIGRRIYRRAYRLVVQPAQGKRSKAAHK